MADWEIGQSEETMCKYRMAEGLSESKRAKTNRQTKPSKSGINLHSDQIIQYTCNKQRSHPWDAWKCDLYWTCKPD